MILLLTRDTISGFQKEISGMDNTNKITYPINQMYEVASQMITNANNAQDNHDRTWGKINWYIQIFPWFMQDALHAVLDPYDLRARESYEWQKAAAYALKSAADTASQAEGDITKSFKGMQGFKGFS